MYIEPDLLSPMTLQVIMDAKVSMTVLRFGVYWFSGLGLSVACGPDNDETNRFTENGFLLPYRVPRDSSIPFLRNIQNIPYIIVFGSLFDLRYIP